LKEILLYNNYNDINSALLYEFSFAIIVDILYVHTIITFLQSKFT